MSSTYFTIRLVFPVSTSPIKPTLRCVKEEGWRCGLVLSYFHNNIFFIGLGTKPRFCHENCQVFTMKKKDTRRSKLKNQQIQLEFSEYIGVILILIAVQQYYTLQEITANFISSILLKNWFFFLPSSKNKLFKYAKLYSNKETERIKKESESI